MYTIGVFSRSYRFEKASQKELKGNEVTRSAGATEQGVPGAEASTGTSDVPSHQGMAAVWVREAGGQDPGPL